MLSSKNLFQLIVSWYLPLSDYVLSILQLFFFQTVLSQLIILVLFANELVKVLVYHS